MRVLASSLSNRKQLPPILPQHAVPAGALVVDKEETRVVYLAPLLSTAKEIYFAKHKELLKGNNNIIFNMEEQEDDESKKQMREALERHLAILQKPEQQTGSLNQELSSSVFDAPSSDLNRNNVAATDSTSATSTDGQLKKMKQRVKLMPISDDDHTAFWDTIRGYERMRTYYHKAVLAGGAATPMGFNMEAAFKRMKSWIELETQFVDAAIDDHENNRSINQKVRPSRKKREVWMRFVPESIRSDVILEFLHKVEKEYREKFHRQEVDFFPQLVQTLRGEHPNRTHGARVTRGSNEGSYVLFSETRLSSEEELLLTAIHERELAEMINDIPCKNKFVALELCQAQEPKDEIIEVDTIRHRIHEQFFPQFYKQLVQLRLKNLLERGVRLSRTEKLTAETVQTNPELFNLILMESCNVKTEVPVRANEERVSNFLLRFRDAFRGAAITPKLDEENNFQQGLRPPLFAKQVLEYVCRSIREDAVNHNARVHAEYKSQVRTRYEHAAEFQIITHTPAVLGVETIIDFGLGEILGTQSLNYLQQLCLCFIYCRATNRVTYTTSVRFINSEQHQFDMDLYFTCFKF
ncbi:hypothetical protein PHMEG_000379 [Phytophthora megakarya]|uniref:Uncharacterized protein n=1 Tax=Phytophthora megakarya TaxID=4795 RepID=A0A225X372_9STRA|nr:hypothetical protein PHMEG_000379 [Phytophthora megakarya]